MATSKSAAKSTTKKNAPSKSSSGKRDLIKPNGDVRYVKRDNGKFTESDDVGKSLTQDRKQKAKTTVEPGYGDKGDQKKALPKKAAAKKAAPKKAAAKSSGRGDK